MIFNIFLMFWIIINFDLRVQCLSANLSVKEEFQPNQVIGNIKSALPEKLKSSSLKFNADSSFINIKDNGDVTLKKKIDLETLCQNSKICCGLLLCVIPTNVLVNENNEFVESLYVNLQIEDLNDNEPQFLTNEQTIALRESLPVNYSTSLESAVDRDFSAENRILHYKLDDPFNKFELDESKFPQISLRLKSELDYESRNQYTLKLKACDKEFCPEKTLIIDVQDENDNKPQFTLKNYKASILENTDTGSLVLTVNAHDADSGDFGKISYSIEAPNDSDLLQTFGINTNSGEIRLERKLAANLRKTYFFYVVAKDNDFNNPQKDKVPVEINVVDINNYHPIITVLANNERVEVRENSPPGNLVTIKVTDHDIGLNSKVNCELLPESKIDFQLLKKSENLYSLASIRSFDFESGQLKSASIKCIDSGVPPKSSDRSILVHITDMNEYQPEFQQQIYEVNLKENSATNIRVVCLNATDRDGAPHIRYILDQKGQKYFKIDHVTGWIKTTNMNLDREVIETIVFNAFAIDATVDPYTATTKVIVTIEDENDNAPVFGVIPEFTINENMISTRLNGRLSATDADKGINSQLEFILLKTLARKQEVHKIFAVSKDGFIETLQSLDRETFGSYILEVGVRDKGQYPMATSNNITVTVIDENDNKPQWIYPNPINPEYNISRVLNKNDIIMTVKAFDTDDGENGRVIYRLHNPKPNSKQCIFSVDETTGEIRIIKEMDMDQVKLTLIASDCGITPKTSLLELIVNNHSRLNSSPSVSVIIILISVTGFISIVLVVSIICVRKRPMGTGIKYSCPNTIDIGKTNMAEWTFQDSSIYKQKPGIQLRNDYQLPPQNIASSRTSYEPIDAEESGDSGKGPSEDIRNAQYLDQNQIFARNYANMQWKIPSPIPSTACNGRQLYMLPDRSMNLHSNNYGSPYPTLMVSKPNTEIITMNNNNNNNNNININNKPINGVDINDISYLSFNSFNVNEFSLPRSPDYYQTSNSQSQIYETPDCFNSELDITQIQQSNI